MVTSKATDWFYTSVILVFYSHQIAQALFVAYSGTVKAQAIEGALLLNYCMVSGFDVAERWKLPTFKHVEFRGVKFYAVCYVGFSKSK
jgi:hypothetical protein